jgi:ABC-type transporter Mla subunit MlaD
MAMFGLKEVLDPLAQNLAQSAREITDALRNIQDALDLNNELTQTTNRLLAQVVENTAKPRPKARQS